MDEHEELENKIREITREVLENGKNGSKKKREPSKWNLFLKDCAPKQPKDMAFGDKIKACSAEYKKTKGSQDQESMESQSQQSSQQLNDDI